MPRNKRISVHDIRRRTSDERVRRQFVTRTHTRYIYLRMRTLNHPTRSNTVNPIELGYDMQNTLPHDYSTYIIRIIYIHIVLLLHGYKNRNPCVLSLGGAYIVSPPESARIIDRVPCTQYNNIIVVTRLAIFVHIRNAAIVRRASCMFRICLAARFFFFFII